MKYFKLNQTVHHPIYGAGVIVTGYLNKYPIQVQFMKHKSSFTYDGRENEGGKITLSQTPIPEIVNKPLSDEYIPFTFEDRELLRGKWIRKKETNIENFITNFYYKGVGTDNDSFSFNLLLSDYEFIDGKPCGKLVN